MDSLKQFSTQPFIQALKSFFRELNIPINHFAETPARPADVLGDKYNPNHPAHRLMEDVYVVGLVDDAAFASNRDARPCVSTVDDVKKISVDYDGLLILGITLSVNHPTRTQLAEITRAFNRVFHYTPVVIVFHYDNMISFANSERLKYKQGWREGEKAGKVSLLRDIDINKPHRGHIDILNALSIQTKGKGAVNSFASLYSYWQEVFNVSILNKKFYKELQNWYFWAIKEVTFPNAPNRFDFESNEKFDEAVKEHKAKNVIRLLTRILFIWFIKEKGLIPEEIFDEKAIADKLIKDFTPQKPVGLFSATGKHTSPYYRAILQNLFFATLNQEMGKRTFRGDGKHQNVTNLMRYREYFKNPDYFVQLMEEVVPFMNGGLFECLDKPHATAKGKQGGDIIIYNDGFSDREDNELHVPDYLFFDVDEDVDLSDDFGSKDKAYKNAKTRGLLEILKSYKFTITENTPIEEDVALDPELLGKVFENLLASYNPETKTTARKQTGSFYTPREIVNYMVDESLIAYLKTKLLDEAPGVAAIGSKQIEMFGNEIGNGQLRIEEKVNGSNWIGKDEELETNLRVLLSYDSNHNPFEEKDTARIIRALDQCTILDPACGSGAFPMGVLQKMVHLLHKVDPNNTEWKKRQIDRVNVAITNLEEIDDDHFREQTIRDLKAQIKDIEESFSNNELDYGRKLYLIENCIYGVDIQPIATQISKLRFFISLIVDQKIDKSKENFGIRPLPNLETKFVAANTLIGIEKPKAQQNLFDNREVKKLEAELKKVRHKLFSAKTPVTKKKLREQDKEIRDKIADHLVEEGWHNDTARQLAGWDPYDQNTSSPFFDPEWMFDISEGFDVVIGNPPYLGNKEIGAINQAKYKAIFGFTDDMYNYFYHKGISFLCSNGIITYITPNTFLSLSTKKNLRRLFVDNTLKELFLVGYVFEEAYVDTVISFVVKCKREDYQFNFKIAEESFLTPTVFKESIDIYKESYDNLFYPPSKVNIAISALFSNALSDLSEYRGILYNNNSLKKSYSKIQRHRNALRVGDLTYLGLVAEGAQGLVTGNNSKYLAIICKDIIEQQRISNELVDRISTYGVDIDQKRNEELYEVAEKIKRETNNPSFFGKFYIYKTVLLQNVKYLSELTEVEQINGSKSNECWIFYSRGNEDGVKWKVPFVEAINWTFEYVNELKGSVNTNSRWQGSEFYSSTGFGWVDYFTNQIKAFFVEKGPYSKNVVKFHSMIYLSDIYFTAILNSKFTTYYVKNFITNTHTLQINDGKLIPIKIPSNKMLGAIEILAHIVIETQEFFCEQVLDSLVYELYLSDHMKEREIDVLQFVDCDIDKVMQGQEFEKLNKPEKQELIERLRQGWSNPESEVMKRISLFKERSPEILKPILES